MSHDPGHHPPQPGTERKAGYRQRLSDGLSDNLQPTESIDLARAGTISELLDQMSRTAFGGRRLGEAAEVLEAMIRDEDCFVVGTFSGAMTVAKQGLVLCDMIEQGMLQAVVATGALMTHGLVSSVGMQHFKYDPRMDDTELYEKGYNRVYDTLELEGNLDDTELIVREVLRRLPEGAELHSSLICSEIGRYLHENVEGRGILKSAFERGVPVYVPAFTDSELGLDVAITNRLRRREGLSRRVFDPFLDLEDYTAHIYRAQRIGIFTIGGGVPRNWAQQVGPYLDIIDKRIGEGGALKRFHYGVRICPEPDHWGGLSGCSYSEGVSWGKFVPPAEGGRYAEVHADATIGWPILVKAVQERLSR
jgi:deoxyhypusine synthase